MNGNCPRYILWLGLGVTKCPCLSLESESAFTVDEIVDWGKSCEEEEDVRQVGQGLKDVR
jgi:hypothetical protein